MVDCFSVRHCATFGSSIARRNVQTRQSNTVTVCAGAEVMSANTYHQEMVRSD